jgi:hypothetical protein
MIRHQIRLGQDQYRHHRQILSWAVEQHEIRRDLFDQAQRRRRRFGRP